MNTKIYFDLLGFDFIGEVDFSVTSWGSCDSWEEPGDPIEVEIDSILICIVTRDLVRILQSMK
jgi:hypothetical protein